MRRACFNASAPYIDTDAVGVEDGDMAIPYGSLRGSTVTRAPSD